jgi:hypothetical protein
MRDIHEARCIRQGTKRHMDWMIAVLSLGAISVAIACKGEIKSHTSHTSCQTSPCSVLE